ncbi:bacillithiol biosynthesis deacetylase BshB2 [Pseudalkalibacillus berkeleyi]|uniref:Bacillithiol biosynthesis deacetylase BshB2 n=1 Tax=Pseudalkalibacillus berkeleyi TaxID=1069813 RepID=A0ABS9H5Q3_9BACL|nr:bacillithiol biosynthesis deacetylase BshB2 [Pseudalkalibacillus berkeleyi]MCF6139015.1 bacillithiol biosynthesis deacetylase BshB2 [Pseudalkalibacillus berkeleyi]
MEKQVLVIFPHPDDEAFGVSGSIAKYIDEGTPVTYMCLTLGEMGRNMGNPPFATRETLPEIRKQELQEASKVLGIQDLRMMGLRDKTIEFEDPEMLADLFTDAINELDPSLIITFYPGYSVHPDHDACGAAVIKAVQNMPKAKRPKVECVAFSHNCEEELGRPDVIRDVSDFMDQKLNTLEAHKSQTAGLMEGMKKRLQANEEELMNWIKFERFWTYPFNER